MLAVLTFSSVTERSTPPVQSQVIERERESGSVIEVMNALLQEEAPAA
jgi:hypothetical protein